MSTFKIYEGMFFGLSGESRPEGGIFHFTGQDNSLQTDASAPGVPPDLLNRYNNWRAQIKSSGAKVQTPSGQENIDKITASMALRWSSQSPEGWGPFTQAEWDMIANNYHFDTAFASQPGYLSPKAREVDVDKGAPLSDRQRTRKHMIDGNPDTFWECEYVVDASEAVGRITESNLMDGSSEEAPQATMGDLLTMLTSPEVDKLDLDCSIIIELPSAQIINWINMLPHNFSDVSWLEVLDVSTSLDGSNYEPLEGFNEHKYENILTDDVNKELSQDEAAMTLAPNKFQYTGQGVWTFPAREAKFIKITLLQKAPIPAPYDVSVAELTQTLTTTVTTKRDSGFFSSESTRTRQSSEEQQKEVELSYIDTLKVSSGNSNLDGLETSPNTTQGAAGGQSAGNLIVGILTVELLGGSVHRDKRIEESGWKVKNTYTRTKWDKARYAIGIKELGVWSYKYNSSSGLVSMPFKSPKPIRSVSLLADELIPKAFMTSGSMRPWIRYWASLDDGLSWQAIAPAGDSPTVRVDGIRIPQVIHVNSGLPESERDPRAGYVDFSTEVNTVRLKAILERPDSIEDMTPVLKGYRLRLVTRGGL